MILPITIKMFFRVSYESYDSIINEQEPRETSSTGCHQIMSTVNFVVN